MGSREMRVLFKETRLNLEPTAPSSIVQIRIPSQGHTKRSSLRRLSGAGSSSNDEKTYLTNNLARASSIYHRKHHASPRSFLWRVLENGTILNIRAVDVIKQKRESEARLVLHLQFPEPLRTACIEFSDPQDHDALCVFVIDQANNLHSITLRLEVFRKRSATDGTLGEACKSYSSPGLAFKHPHRLVVVDPDQLIVTMHDGGILRFDKNRGDNGQIWKETPYNVAGWGQHLSRWAPFQRHPTIKYDKISMETTAATSTAVTSMGQEGSSFLFTICLDHQMRVWDVRTGQIVYTGDILGAERDSQNVSKWLIDPSQTSLIRIVENFEGQEYQSLVVVFSPKGAGEFKFWRVKADDQGSLYVVPWFPEHRFIPPSPSTDVWTMADFAISQRTNRLELWALWKNNITYRVQKLEVRPLSANGSFHKEWSSVYIEHALPSVETSGPCDPVDTAERWLDHILYPGRFSKSSIETALVMYEKGLGTYKETSKSGKGLAETICSVLGATASLDRNSAGILDYEQFRGTSETQWLRLWRLLLELEKARCEALSLVCDGASGFVCVVCADCIAAVRKCSDMERLYHNMKSPEKSHKDLGALVMAGLVLLESFTDNMTQLAKSALRVELFEDSPLPALQRIQNFAERAAFWRQLADEECAVVTEYLGEHFRVVTPRLYRDLFNLIAGSKSQDPRYPLTDMGRKLVVRNVQATAELHWRVLFSQLILLVHMETELEGEDDALRSRIGSEYIFCELITALRRLEHVMWMTQTEMALPTKSDRSGSFSASFNASFSSTATSPTMKRSHEDARMITAFEGLVGHLMGLADLQDDNLVYNMTDIAVKLCSPGSDTELIPYLQQCWFLKLERPDLAMELSPFSDSNPFSTYVQGRVFIALKDYDTAAQYFRKASIGLSIPSQPGERHSVGLLDDTEWDLFFSGFLNYYLHIVNLFDRHRAYSYVIELARLALQFSHANGAEDAKVKTELQSRLFTASTAISHFDIAHSTLLAMENDALQRSYLQKLVERMCETGQNTHLVSLPFSGLQSKVDSILLEKCRATRDVLHGTPYHQILYAWRISRGDFRGGATILLDRLRKLRQAGEGERMGTEDAMDMEVTRQYLLLINALSCVESKEAFLLEDVSAAADQDHHQDENRIVANGSSIDKDDLEANLDDLLSVLDADAATSQAGRKDASLVEQMARYARLGHKDPPPRRFLTMGDLRRDYQQELDRIAAIQTNQFGLTGEEEDDVMDFPHSR